MLRTRIYLGLLPLMLVVIAMGVYSIEVSRNLAGSLQEDLVAEYQDVLACERLKAAARAMANAAARAREGDMLGARSSLEASRSAFTRELMAQSAGSAGKPRVRAVEAIDTAFQGFSGPCEALLAAGGTGTLETLGAVDAALFRVLHAVDELSRLDFSASNATAARAGRLAATAARVLLAAVLVAFVLSAVLAWRLASSLLRARNTMEATLSSTPDPVFVVTGESFHEVRNPAAAQLARQPEFARGFPPPIAGPLSRVLETGEHYLPKDYGCVVALRVGREDRFYLPRILAIGDKLTRFKGAAIVLQDVTRFRLLDDAKTNLVGTVSHELKTPLTSLRMAILLLLEERLGSLIPAQRELLESARDDADRLLRILDSLLDLARLEAGAAALERRSEPVGTLLARIAAEAGPLLAAVGRRFVVSEDPGCEAVNVDPDRIRHVFINLLGNAAKYAPKGSVVALSARPAPPGFVRFGVRDEGPGIPGESIGRLFDRFYRVPGQSMPGAGIGLAIAREIVVAHGGSIACESVPGRGADFHFLLPTFGPAG